MSVITIVHFENILKSNNEDPLNGCPLDLDIKTAPSDRPVFLRNVSGYSKGEVVGEEEMEEILSFSDCQGILLS